MSRPKDPEKEFPSSSKEYTEPPTQVDPQTQKTLSEILDQIESRARATIFPSGSWTEIREQEYDAAIQASQADVPALVKALRRAAGFLESFKPDGWEVRQLAHLLREPANSVVDGEQQPSEEKEPSSALTHVLQNALGFGARCGEILRATCGHGWIGHENVAQIIDDQLATLLSSHSNAAGAAQVNPHGPNCWCPDCELERANQPWKSPFTPSALPPLIQEQKWTVEQNEFQLWIEVGGRQYIFDKNILNEGEARNLEILAELHNATLGVRSPATSVESPEVARERFQNELRKDFGGLLNEAQIERFGEAAHFHFTRSAASPVSSVEQEAEKDLRTKP